MRREVKKILRERTEAYGSFGENASFTQGCVLGLGWPSLTGYDAYVLAEAAHMMYHKLGRVHIGGDTPGNQDSFIDCAGYAIVCARHMLGTQPNWTPREGKGELYEETGRGRRVFDIVDAMMPTIFEYTERAHVGEAMLHLGQRLQSMVDK